MEVVIKSNEVDESRTTFLATQYLQSGEPTASLYVASSECPDNNANNQDFKDICIADPTGAPRFYQIEVRVSDAAGNEAVDVSQIIVVPKSSNRFKIDYIKNGGPGAEPALHRRGAEESDRHSGVARIRKIPADER